MKLKTISIKGKSYVEVSERVKAFRKDHKDFGLITEIISIDNGVVIMKASVINTEGRTIATGYAYEKEGSTFINKTSFIENCETSAIGRALGNFGIGIDNSYSSAHEVGNAIKQQSLPEVVPTPKKEVKKLNPNINESLPNKKFKEMSDRYTKGEYDVFSIFMNKGGKLSKEQIDLVVATQNNIFKSLLTKYLEGNEETFDIAENNGFKFSNNQKESIDQVILGRKKKS